MPIFMSVALLAYGSMRLYALGKVWRIFPRSFRMTLALTLSGLA